MRIITPSVTLLSITPNPELVIEYSGRVAYKSEDKISKGSAEKFIQMLIRRGHESVLEHASASLLFVCDRGITHEMVRHRVASYTQESTRYCCYTHEKFSGLAIMDSPELTPEQQKRREDLYEHSERVYKTEIKEGLQAQIARDVLPTVVKTEIVMTANFREWRHFFKMRCDAHAHPRIKKVAKMALDILSSHSPTVFKDLKEKFDEPA